VASTSLYPFCSFYNNNNNNNNNNNLELISNALYKQVELKFGNVGF